MSDTFADAADDDDAVQRRSSRESSSTTIDVQRGIYEKGERENKTTAVSFVQKGKVCAEKVKKSRV